MAPKWTLRKCEERTFFFLLILKFADNLIIDLELVIYFEKSDESDDQEKLLVRVDNLTVTLLELLRVLMKKLALLLLFVSPAVACLTCCVEPLPDGTCCCLRPPKDNCPPLPPSCKFNY